YPSENGKPGILPSQSASPNLGEALLDELSWPASANFAEAGQDRLSIPLENGPKPSKSCTFRALPPIWGKRSQTECLASKHAGRRVGPRGRRRHRLPAPARVVVGQVYGVHAVRRPPEPLLDVRLRLHDPPAVGIELPGRRHSLTPQLVPRDRRQSRQIQLSRPRMATRLATSGASVIGQASQHRRRTGTGATTSRT